MKKKKGFTLIELLAVIVILAVLAVITVVIIGNVIEDAKIKKYYSEEKAMERAAELYLLKNQNALGNGVESQVITLQQLMDAKTMKAVHDTGNGGLCDTAESKVIVTSSTNPKKVTYKGCLKCSNYKTAGEECGYEEEQEEEEEIVEDKVPCELETEENDSKNYYYIDSEADLYAFSKSVNDGHDYSGEIIMVRNNLDMSKTISGETKTICDTKGVTTTSFAPIGKSDKPFKGTFEGSGKTISNLTINLPEQDNVGLFGYNSGTVKGFNLANVNITGKNNVGGIVGYNYSVYKNWTSTIATINEVSIQGSVKGNENVGGAAGITYSGDTRSYVTNILANVNVEGSNWVGGLVGQTDIYRSDGYVSGILEGGSVKGTSNVAKIASGDGIASTSSNSYATIINAYTSSSVTMTGGRHQSGTSYYTDGIVYDSSFNNRLNGYDYILDTYLGGDNDSSNYYYDYDSKGKIKVISAAKKPIPSLSSLTKDGDYYEIGSVSDWNVAVANPKENYKLTSDIDFNNKRFYMLGSNSNIVNNSNIFAGIIYGDGHTIKNANVEGINNTGIIGYASAKSSESKKIEYVNFDNIKVNGANNVGLIGYNSIEVKGINATNINVTGNNNVGGIVGYNYSKYTGGYDSYSVIATINEVSIQGSVKGNENVGGAAGITYSGDTRSYVTNILANVNVEGSSWVGGLVGQTDIYRSDGYVSGILEGGSVKGTSNVAKIASGDGIASTSSNSYATITNAYTSSSVTMTGGRHQSGTSYYTDGIVYDSSFNNRLNGYDYILDTYLGGDNDSSNYYYDYDSKGKIKVISAAKKPIPSLSSLTKDGDYYEIGSVSDWNVAVANPKEKYKLTKDIDFNNKRFYMLGSKSNITSNDNSFTGSLYGDGHTIKNVNAEGINYSGVIGYKLEQSSNPGIEYINFDNISISGNNYVGLIGYSIGKTTAINLKNANVTGNDYVGGIVGYGYSQQINSTYYYFNINEVTVQGNITGNNNVGGAVGYSSSYNNYTRMEKMLANVNVTGSSWVGGLVGQSVASRNSLYIIGVLEGGSVNGTSNVAKITTAGSNSICEGYDSSWCYDIIYAYTSSSVTMTGGRHQSGTNYYSDGTEFSNAYYNNLSRYATYGLETPQTGDTNESGYYFDYNGDASDILVAKAYQPSSDDDQHATTDVTPIVHTNDSCSDNVAPTCTLTSFAPRSQRDGMTASFECIDDVDVEKISSYFHSTRKNTAESFDMIGTEKTITAADKFDKGAKHYSIWTAQTDPSHVPYPNTCYYFHYGAKDACGNYTAYVTNYCLSY